LEGVGIDLNLFITALLGVSQVADSEWSPDMVVSCG